MGYYRLNKRNLKALRSRGSAFINKNAYGFRKKNFNEFKFGGDESKDHKKGKTGQTLSGQRWFRLFILGLATVVLLVIAYLVFDAIYSSS